MASNAVPPSVTPPSPFEWPETIKAITNVTTDSQAKVTCPTHGFGSEDVGQTFVMFLQVKGMLPINGLSGLIQSIVDANNFTVDVNTTFFPIYRSGGVISILTGQPPVETVGFQTFNTPFQNIATTN
jgi:hypothetical protein